MITSTPDHPGGGWSAPTAPSDLAATARNRVRRADVTAALALARELGTRVPLPARGDTLARWDLLAEVAAADLTTARVLEPHLDALAILAESGRSDPADAGATWGVYAAEAPGAGLTATGDDRRGWRLAGRKPWCSLAGRLDRALVTATADGDRRLFAVPLDDPGVRVVEGAWHARGLVDIPSGPIDLSGVAAEPVGAPGWYLRRPGFAHGGIGVAACWFGSTAALAARAVAGSRGRPADQLALWHLGEIDLAVGSARRALLAAAADVDAGRADGVDGELLALRVRATVAAAAETVLTRVGHALGPGPLTGDPDHAARVADLTVYLRQHHAERDVARIGERVLAAGDGA